MNTFLITALTINGIRYTTANLLAAMGKIKVNMTVSFVGIIAPIVLNFHLMPIFGAAFTSIIVYSLMAFAVFISFVAIYRAK